MTRLEIHRLAQWVRRNPQDPKAIITAIKMADSEEFRRSYAIVGLQPLVISDKIKKALGTVNDKYSTSTL